MHQSVRKSRVFVGSSVESLPYAYAVQENLDPHDAEVKVWPQGVFEMAAYALESLLEALKVHDFGVFLFAADDVLTDLHLPTDLLGWNIGYYDPTREDHVAALGVACNQIRRAIRRLGSLRANLPTSEAFTVEVPAEELAPFPSISVKEIQRDTIETIPDEPIPRHDRDRT